MNRPLVEMKNDGTKIEVRKIRGKLYVVFNHGNMSVMFELLKMSQNNVWFYNPLVDGVGVIPIVK